MKNKKIFLALLTSIFLNISSIAYAEEGAGKIAVALDNDLFFGKDRDYTNGLFLSWTPKDSRFNFTLAQKMYTPEHHDKQVYSTDHPYAGYAYFETKYQKLLIENFRGNVGLTIAQIGPRAKAQWTQNRVHRHIGSKEFKGWDYQIPNRKGYLVNVGADYLIPVLSFDTNLIDMQNIAYINGTSGNIENAARAGLEMNLGYNVGKFSDKIDPDQRFRLYLFAKGGVKKTDKDYILEGNNGRIMDGQTWDIKIKKTVYTINYGIAAGWKDVDAKVYIEQHTREYLSQQQRYQIGGMQLSWKY